MASSYHGSGLLAQDERGTTQDKLELSSTVLVQSTWFNDKIAERELRILASGKDLTKR